MPVLTVEEQLIEVQTAITAVMTNQAYSLGGRMVKRADLEFLHKRETYLRSALARENGQRPTAVAINFDGMGY